ncbi:pyridoxamine 5'-phosphate oxidase family protein [Allosalinactinospora lopnorensis]|uniref:pyridoxamine 5'-phosphate oxidase family protein n=1 Tax=Allosalinactinospora lopnorensis TaxID=1352348 RepID=UPI003083FF3D
MTTTPARYAPTPRTTPTRKNDRVDYDRTLVHEILDAEYLCHVGFVADTAPVVLPTLYARMNGHLYLHGSSGSRLVLLAQEACRCA